MGTELLDPYIINNYLVKEWKHACAILKSEFPCNTRKKIEVFDTLSNIIIYDINKNIITSCHNLLYPNCFETFPTWSPDGFYLYFCCAKKQPFDKYDQIRYDLLRIAFDPKN